MGRSLLGTPQTLAGFSRDNLQNYLSTHYHGPDMVVAAAGAVDHKSVVAEVEQREDGVLGGRSVVLEASGSGLEERAAAE